MTKKETYADNLAKLLGLSEVKAEEDKQKEVRQGNVQAVSEEEIQGMRFAQGILYYLKAPELFSYRECKRCTTPFLVSRLLVAYCSYNCIKAALNDEGFEWRRGENLEAIVRDSYEGNEPIWIRNPERLKLVLEKLVNSLESQSSLTPTHQALT